MLLESILNVIHCQGKKTYNHKTGINHALTAVIMQANSFFSGFTGR